MQKPQQLSFIDFEEVSELFPPIPKKGSKIILPKKSLNAAEMFEPFFISTYIPMKHNEKHLDLIKSEMKERLKNDERKRIEFPKFELVAKWRVIPKYETDYVKLNELLFDHGLLQLINLPNKGLDAEVKEILEPFKLASSSYVVPTVTSKKAKEKMAEHYKDFEIVEDVETDNILAVFSRFHSTNKQYEAAYDLMKKQMIACNILQKEKKLTFEYGSVRLQDSPQGYDKDSVIDFLGIEFLLEHGRPDMQALDFFMDKGMVNRKEVESFRKEVNRRMDFLLMTKESEEKQFEVYQKKLERKIRLSMKK